MSDARKYLFERTQLHVVDCPALTAAPFPACVADIAHAERDAHGGVSHCGSWAWLSCGTRLDVVQTHSNTLMATYDFAAMGGADSRGAAIATVLEVPFVVDECDLLMRESFLLVAMEAGNGSSTLHLFDLASANVVLTIAIPHQITCMTLVTSPGLPFTSRPSVSSLLSTSPALASPLSAPVNKFVGCAALGTSQGRVLLIDLRLDTFNPSSRRMEGLSTRCGVDMLQPGRPRTKSDRAVACVELGGKRRVCMSVL